MKYRSRSRPIRSWKTKRARPHAHHSEWSQSYWSNTCTDSQICGECMIMVYMHTSVGVHVWVRACVCVLAFPGYQEGLFSLCISAILERNIKFCCNRSWYLRACAYVCVCVCVCVLCVRRVCVCVSTYFFCMYVQKHTNITLLLITSLWVRDCDKIYVYTYVCVLYMYISAYVCYCDCRIYMYICVCAQICVVCAYLKHSLKLDLFWFCWMNLIIISFSSKYWQK